MSPATATVPPTVALAKALASLPMPPQADPRIELQDRLQAARLLMNVNAVSIGLEGPAAADMMHAGDFPPEAIGLRWPTSKTTIILYDQPVTLPDGRAEHAVAAIPKAHTIRFVHIIVANDRVYPEGFELDPENGQVSPEDPSAMFQPELTDTLPQLRTFYAHLTLWAKQALAKETNQP